MIREINNELVLLQEKVARKKRLEKQLKELFIQGEDYCKRVERLEKIKLKEDKDVRRIEGISLQALVYAISGKKSEKIDKEKREAYAATVKYDMAVREIEEIFSRIDSYKEELASLSNVEIMYEDVLNRKIDYVKNQGHKESHMIAQYEKLILDEEKKLVEIREAIDAGKSALAKAKKAIDSLDSASSYGTWDMFGGGVIASMCKHDCLDKAQTHVTSLQRHLRKFNAELADVDMDMKEDINVKVSAGLGFADYFFDGFFVDAMVQQHISDSVSRVKDIERTISSVLSNLNEKEYNINDNKRILKEKIEKLVLDI